MALSTTLVDARGTYMLGSLSPDLFLRDYWQKQPCLIRQGLAGFRSPVSPEELAGLACVPQVESRLVMERGGQHPWEVRHGPFREAEFTVLPSSHWTLLVQEANKHIPAAAELLRHFRFLPDWRIDDVMISYAPVGGSVGPHLDSYDVFLVQALGTRRWSIAEPGAFSRTLLPDLELGILADFSPAQEWVLSPGDILYLPPDIAHHGVALEPCQTWSVGFRAPSHAQIADAVSDYAGDDQQRWRDPELPGQADHPAEISDDSLEQAARLAARFSEPGHVARWFGCLVTENRSGLYPEAPASPLSKAAFSHLLSAEHRVAVSCLSRFAYCQAPDAALLFVDGQRYELEPRFLPALRRLCDRHRPGAAEIIHGQAWSDLMYTLYLQGALYRTDH